MRQEDCNGVVIQNPSQNLRTGSAKRSEESIVMHFFFVFSQVKAKSKDGFFASL
jgi:hypothetical protein